MVDGVMGQYLEVHLKGMTGPEQEYPVEWK